MKLLAKGKRSRVFWISKNRVLKQKSPETKAEGTIEREYKTLKILNRYNIGPKVYKWDNGIVMEYIDGERIRDFIAHADRKDILKVLEIILKKLRKLDLLKLNKEELVNPYKHILVKNREPRLIDFERCKKVVRPQNLTQFTSFLLSISPQLARKGIFAIPWRLKSLAATYKHSQTELNYSFLKDEILQKGITARIYFACSHIPKGRVSSYKALGDAAGIKGYRAVGQAMNKNQFGVPCHRVINADGRLGGFRRGIPEKIKLLKQEGVQIVNGRVPKRYFC